MAYAHHPSCGGDCCDRGYWCVCECHAAPEAVYTTPVPPAERRVIRRPWPRDSWETMGYPDDHIAVLVHSWQDAPFSDPRVADIVINGQEPEEQVVLKPEQARAVAMLLLMAAEKASPQPGALRTELAHDKAPFTVEIVRPM